MDNNLTDLWEKVIKEMQPKVSFGVISALFKTARLFSLENNTATIATPSIAIMDMLQKRFAKDIKEILSRETKSEVSVVFVPKAFPQEPKVAKKGEEAPLFSTAPEITAKPAVGHLPRVRSDYTFGNFAVSGSNQLAFVSSQTVAENIGRSYNPLFIYGPVGVGKTHLMHAIANSAYQKQPGNKIIYITSEEFTNEVVDAIRNNDTSRMKKRFRSAHILIIDDIQFIEGKEKVQEELFHTFNILIDSGAQICLTSDRPPQEIKKLEKRLSSRFAGGLAVDVGKPDLELKTAILQKKAEKFGRELSTEVALSLAGKAEDTRSLEGLLLRVITESAANDSEISLDLVDKALGGMAEERRGRIHAEDIVKAVCDFYKIKQTQLKGPKRDAALVRARQVCMYLLYKELKITLVEVGNLLGGRDHTTIMHGVEKIEGFVQNEAGASIDIVGIKQVLFR